MTDKEKEHGEGIKENECVYLGMVKELMSKVKMCGWFP